jgi:(p)ppGpp synthase/HD superfamily hydrolase
MPPHEIDVEFLWNRLEHLLDHLPEAGRQKVLKALKLAIFAHEGQFRKSGEPFVTHPVEVTRILAELSAEAVRLWHA